MFITCHCRYYFDFKSLTLGTLVLLTGAGRTAASASLTREMYPREKRCIVSAASASESVGRELVALRSAFAACHGTRGRLSSRATAAWHPPPDCTRAAEGVPGDMRHDVVHSGVESCAGLLLV